MSKREPSHAEQMATQIFTWLLLTERTVNRNVDHAPLKAIIDAGLHAALKEKIEPLKRSDNPEIDEAIRVNAPEGYILMTPEAYEMERNVWKRKAEAHAAALTQAADDFAAGIISAGKLAEVLGCHDKHGFKHHASSFDEQKSDAAALADRLTRLKFYAHHEPTCRKYMSLGNVPCTCGLDALLALPKDGEAP